MTDLPPTTSNLPPTSPPPTSTAVAEPELLIESKPSPSHQAHPNDPRDRGGYLDRLAERRFVTDLKQTIVFGYTAGFLLAVICFFKYRYTANWSDSLMLALAWAGVGIIAITLLTPTLLNPIRILFVKVTGKIGATIFSAILTLLYLLVFTPLALFRRARSGTAPFYWWNPDESPLHHFPASDWTVKTIPPEIETPANARPLPLLLQPLRLIRYFSNRGQYALIPFLILLILLGLTMFFIQTSALAPFIYTLF